VKRMERNEIRFLWCGDSAVRERLAEQYPGSPSIKIVNLILEKNLSLNLCRYLVNYPYDDIDLLMCIEHGRLIRTEMKIIADYFGVPTSDIWG